MPANPPLSTLTRMNSTVKDLFIYIYDLSTLEFDLLFLMIKRKKPATLEEIAKAADRDKSTIFRSLQKLVALGIIIKETKTIKEGGYYHVYTAIDVKTFKLETEKRVKELEDSFHRILKKFEDSLQEIVTTVYEQ